MESSQTPAGVPTRDELAQVMRHALADHPRKLTAAVITPDELDALAGAALALVLERHRDYRNARKRASRARQRGSAKRAA
jgi:hypothetical protein